MNANIQYIDFEGRTDGESIYKLMTGLRPRRVILVSGNVSCGEVKPRCLTFLPMIHGRKHRVVTQTF